MKVWSENDGGDKMDKDVSWAPGETGRGLGAWDGRKGGWEEVKERHFINYLLRILSLQRRSEISLHDTL